MQSRHLAILNAERAGRRPVVLVTDMASHAQRVVTVDTFADDPLAEPIAQHLRLGRSGLVQVGERGYFLTVQVPPVRLLIIGAVHIAQSLAPMAGMVDLDVTIIDPRTAFATPDRFPGIAVLAEWPDEALARLGVDRYTAMALLTHDPKIDDQALLAALRADCFYIGALGSRKTHGKRLERMREQGMADSALARIHAPVGLDIGAVSPGEIAVAVLAEIVAAMRRKPLRDTGAAA